MKAEDYAMALGDEAKIGDFVYIPEHNDFLRCDGCDRPFAADASLTVIEGECYCDVCKVAA